jgi:superfamily II DNA or RNA helicase
MIEVTINNATCQLINSDQRLDARLKRELAYTDSNVEYSLFKNEREIENLNNILDAGSRFTDPDDIERKLARALHINRALRKKLMISLYEKGTFPTGLLPRVISILDEMKYQVKLNDLRKKPAKQINFVLKDSLPALRYYQKTAARKLEEEGRGIVVMPTGTGKTVTIARMIWDLGVKTLIITPSKRINSMMLKTMEKHFGKGKVAKLTTKSGRLDKLINIVNIQALIKMDPAALADVQAVFIDEFHHSAAETYREVNIKHLKNCYYRIGMTATNFRNDGSDIALESVLSHVLYEYTIEQAIKDRNIMQPEFEIVDFQHGSYNNWQEAYKDGIVLNEDRNALIADIADQFKDRHVLILVKEIEHGEALKALIPGAEFINGDEKDIIQERMMNDFTKGKLKVLIGTSVIGEGVDLPIADTLIMAGGGKARSQIMQNIGRVLRLHPDKKDVLVFDFSDEGCDWLSEHSLLRQEVYQQYLIEQP